MGSSWQWWAEKKNVYQLNITVVEQTRDVPSSTVTYGDFWLRRDLESKQE
jgi:hypothetical protein